MGGPYEVKCILQAYFDLERGTVPATMRNGAGMWDCAGASDKYHIWACGSFAVHMPIFGAPGMGALVRVKVPGLP